MSRATAQEIAETKFWRMPELVEKLLEYLDEFSILSIVGLKLLTVEVLQAASGTSKRFEPKPLGKLIRKALGFGQPQTFLQQREKVQRISSTLLAQLDSPQHLLLEVLDVICAEYMYVRRTAEWRRTSVIRISCPLHTYHSVSPLGFILLEDCEVAIGINSTKQRVRKIELHGSWDYADCFWETLLLALVARVHRQEVAVQTLAWHSDTFDINSLNWAVAFNALLQKCDQLLNLKIVKVRGEIGNEGWEALAKAMQRHPCRLVFYTSKERMLQIRREDLRTIWEVLPTRPNGSTPSSWTVERRGMEGLVQTDKRFDKACEGPKAEEKSENTWMKLLEYLDEPEEPEDAPRRLRSGRELTEG